MSKQEYAANVRNIGTMSSETDLTAFAFHMGLEFVDDNFEAKLNLRLFKQGISPLWEDPRNRKGGRLIFWYGQQLSKGVACPVWRKAVTHILRGTCGTRHINGAVLHMSASRGVCIEVWTDTADPRQNWIDTLRSKTFPTSRSVEFKPFGAGRTHPRNVSLQSRDVGQRAGRKRPHDVIDLVDGDEGGAAAAVTPSGHRIRRAKGAPERRREDDHAEDAAWPPLDRRHAGGPMRSSVHHVRKAAVHDRPRSGPSEVRRRQFDSWEGRGHTGDNRPAKRRHVVRQPQAASDGQFQVVKRWEREDWEDREQWE